MAEFTLTERTEPLTLEEVFDFIDDTNIGKKDAHELKCRIVDVAQDVRNKAIDEILKRFKGWMLENDGLSEKDIQEIDEIAEQLKGV